MTTMPEYEIEIVRDGPRKFLCAADDVILRAGLRAGMALAYECNVGGCGNCKVQLIEGSVDPGWLEAPGTNARDRDRKRFLACQAKPLSNCKVKPLGLPGGKPNVLPRRSTLKVIDVADITHDIRQFRLQGEEPAQFTAGQYSLLRPHSVDTWRAYSMANISNDEGIWEFMIRRLPNGIVTEVLFDHLKPGDCIEHDGPYGFAGLRRDSSQDILCVAGGSGVSAMLSIIRDIAKRPDGINRKLDFLYGARTPKDLFNSNLLSDCSAPHIDLRFYPVLSEVSISKQQEWQGPTGFVHEQIVPIVGTDLNTYEIYMAGPPVMVDSTLKILTQCCGVDRGRIHYDRFF
jgi:toluene monooxygenase electron transfer component